MIKFIAVSLIQGGCVVLASLLVVVDSFILSETNFRAGTNHFATFFMPPPMLYLTFFAAILSGFTLCTKPQALIGKEIVYALVFFLDYMSMMKGRRKTEEILINFFYLFTVRTVRFVVQYAIYVKRIYIY